MQIEYDPRTGTFVTCGVRWTVDGLLGHIERIGKLKAGEHIEVALDKGTASMKFIPAPEKGEG